MNLTSIKHKSNRYIYIFGPDSRKYFLNKIIQHLFKIKFIIKWSTHLIHLANLI